LAGPAVAGGLAGPPRPSPAGARFADPARHRRVLVTGGLVFAGALAALVTATLLHLHRDWSMLDLQIYRWAGLRARAGADAYRGTYRGLSYTYTPFALVLSALASLAGMGTLRWLVTAASIAALVLSIWVAWGLAGLRRGRLRVGLTLAVAGAGLWLEPVAHTLTFGQINLVLMALVVADLAQPGRRRGKGIGVGVAAAIKLTPAIFIAFLVLTRRWRAAAVAGATFVLALALGFAVFPAASEDFWFGRLFMDAQRVGEVAFVSNQSLNGALVRLLQGVSPAVLPWLACGLAVGAAGLALAVWADAAGEPLAAVLLSALTGLLVSPISWSHHWVWVAPGLVAALDLAVFRRSRAAWALLAGLAGLFAAGPVQLIWRVPHGSNREYHWHSWQLLAGNLYVLAGLALMVAAAAALRRSRRGVAGGAASPAAVPARAALAAGARPGPAGR
jgi:alpha-1,2-mannosyltransferase